MLSVPMLGSVIATAVRSPLVRGLRRGLVIAASTAVGAALHPFKVEFSEMDWGNQSYETWM